MYQYLAVLNLVQIIVHVINNQLIMKNTIIILLLFVLQSCWSAEDGELAYASKSSGVITKISSDKNETIIWVKFITPKSHNGWYVLKFLGSDTCRVGQIILLK